MKYRIKQLKDDKESKLFQRWSQVQNDFDLNDYEVVYEGDIDGNSTYECLDSLFQIFNVERPKDFRGHSLSVSDIVELDGGNFYCDSRGWVCVEDLLEN